MQDDPVNDPDPPLDVHHLLNAQTGRIGWVELQRHFARGLLLRVASGLDLVAVAACIVHDDAPRLQSWLDSGEVGKATLDDARRWEAEHTEFWAVVAAPWVLVQEDRAAGRGDQR